MSPRPYLNHRIRDRALRVLGRHTLLGPQALAGLRGHDVEQTEAGDLRIHLTGGSDQEGRWMLVAWLRPVQTAALLEYLEAERLWGQDLPLFAGHDREEPLSVSGVKRVLYGAEGGR